MSSVRNPIEVKDGAESGAFTYNEAVELTGHGRYNYLVLIACCIITKGVVLDMFGFSVVVAVAKCDLNLGMTETGVLASAPFAGVLLAYPWGYYADTRGRKRALVYSNLVSFVFAAVCSFSHNWQLMMFLKLISCSFSSASVTLTMTFVGECTSFAHRSKYLFIMNSINMLCDTSLFGLAYLLLPLDFSYSIPFLGISFRSWRLLTLVMAVPMGVGGLMMLYLYESPKFLASIGKEEESLEVMRNIYERNGGRKEEFPVKHFIVTDQIHDQKHFWSSMLAQTLPVFRPPLLWRSLQLTYLMVVCICTNNAFSMWFPTIIDMFFTKMPDKLDSNKTFCNRLFEEKALALNSSIYEEQYYIRNTCDDTLTQYTIYAGIAYGLFACTLSLAVSRVASNRRLMFSAWMAVAAASCLLVNVYQPVASIIFFAFIQSAAIGLPCLASYFVDLYPASCRGIVGSLGMMVTRICSLGAVNLVGAAITVDCSLTFYGWAGFLLSGIVVAFFLPSEKKMKEICK